MNNKIGIYGIYNARSGDLLYVGQTRAGFSKRWSSHMSEFKKKGNTKSKKLYSRMKRGIEVEFREIFVIPKNPDSEQYKRILDIEQYFITKLRPLANSQRKRLTKSQIREVEKLIGEKSTKS